jgi:DNA invertase Pin-like site-specific DNA recombinase
MKSAKSEVRKAAIWAAVSSQKQATDDKISIPDQLRLGHEHAQRHGLQVIAELIVPGKSRNIVLFEDACRKIEAYAELHKLIQEKAIDVFIYLNRSRLGRKASLSMAVVELCREAGIICYELESPPATLDPSDSHDEMIVGAIKSVGAQREIITLQHRHKIGMAERIKRGHFPGVIPWGWIDKWVEGIDGKRVLQAVEVDPVAAGHIRTILLDWYLKQGMSQRIIAQQLNELGIATPTGLELWEQASIARMLELIWRYAGYSEMNRKSSSREYVRAKGNWPAIITEQEAEMLLAEVARRADAPRTVSHVKLFSGVVICQRCDHIMSVQTDIGYGSALRCENVIRFGAHRDGTPKKATISHSKLMTALRSDLQGLQDETTRTEILAAAQQSTQSDNNVEQLDALEARLKRLEAAQQRIDSDYYIEERIDTARHTALSADIARQVKEVEQQRTQLRHKLSEQYSYEHFALSLADTAQQWQERLARPVRDANAWLRQTLRIYVQDCAVVEIKYLPPNYVL